MSEKVENESLIKKGKNKLAKPINVKVFTVMIITAIVISVLNFTVDNFLAGSMIVTGIIALIISVAAALIAAVIIKKPYIEVENQKESAQAMSETKSSFLASMSHEIRTPMNSIVGFSELALDGETSLKARDYLQKIKTNAQWMLQIINDILDISKVESGKMELENIPFDMQELFSSCRTLILPKAVEKGITLYFYVEPSIGKKPLGDPTRLRQVLVNLLSNAVKFTNTGMVKLHAVLRNIQGNVITMYFEVKDSGIGMTPELIKNVFDPFKQAAGTARKYGGTGLGLSITKNIVELMGGKLAVESSVGIGSKFSFELKFDAVDINDDIINLEEKIIFSDIVKPQFNGEILLCEDNPMNQQVICEHLKRIGITTVVADNGKAGFDLVKERNEKGYKQFNLIFMDMHMPVMDGLEASLKIMELNTGTPIVAMTANIMFNDREIYAKSGIHDCVGKPFTSQELWRCLMKYFTPVSLISGDNEFEKNKKIEQDMEYQKELQALFVKNNCAKYDEIINALEAGDVSLAHRQAHTLKGNAGQIGKIMLQNAAANIEYNLKSGKNLVTGEQLKILKTELEMVLNEFNSNG